MKKSLLLSAAMVLGMTSVAQAADVEARYQSTCFACHGTGAAGAPKVGDKAAWEPRMAKGIDGLVASAKAGLNAMPPMGTCSDCTDDELKALIEYMTK